MGEKVEYILSLKDLFSPGINRATRATDELDKKVNGLAGSLGGKFAGAFAALGVAGFGMDVVNTTAKMEGMRNAINFASGGAQEGAKSMAFLRAEANRLGLEQESAEEGFKTFAGVLRGTGITADNARKYFSGVSEGVAAMNLSGEDEKGVFLALGQIMSKGKVQAEELRGQIGERIPGAFDIAAKAMGVTTGQLDKMMKDGKLMAKDFLPKFASEMHRTFGPGTQAASQSMQAGINRLKNEFYNLKTELGTELRPQIMGLIDGFSKMFGLIKKGVTWIKDHETGIKSLAVGFGVLGGALLAYNAYARLSNLLSGASTLAMIWQFTATMGLSGGYYALTTSVRAFGAALWGLGHRGYCSVSSGRLLRLEYV